MDKNWILKNSFKGLCIAMEVMNDEILGQKKQKIGIITENFINVIAEAYGLSEMMGTEFEIVTIEFLLDMAESYNSNDKDFDSVVEIIDASLRKFEADINGECIPVFNLMELVDNVGLGAEGWETVEVNGNPFESTRLYTEAELKEAMKLFGKNVQ
jgi:hypothetical protein